MSNKLFGLIIILIIAIFNVTFFLNHHHPTTKSGVLSSLNTNPYPWQPANDKLSSVLSSLNLKPTNNTPEQTHLDIYINQKHLSIPSSIGITNKIKAPINSTTTTGVINFANISAQPYTLGQLFDIWGVKFTNSQLGAYSNNAHNTLSVFDDCKRLSDPVTLKLSNHQEIAVWYGLNNQKPNISCNYHF